jgi:serine/threonine protein kinase
LGVTFFYLLTGKYPFGGQKSITKLVEEIRHTQIDFKIIANQKARACIQRMLDKNPETRITIDELLNTDWVTNSGT